jgi:drug/metabolite transporter (DMT)-like permease
MAIGFMYAIGAAVTWGLIYTIDQKILSGISPVTLLFINSILTAIVMLPLVFFSQGSLKNILVSGRMNLALIIISVLLAILANFLIFSGIKSIGASSASIIEVSYPFFVVLFTFIMFRSSPNIYFFIGGMLILVGSVVIIKFA